MDACGASSSSSPSLSTLKKYDVFLSFRGEDTRNNFTSHLYAALDRNKINTYMDEESLQRGDKIKPTLLEAIQNSQISIIVFSKGYAFSSWCLDELVHILECYRRNEQMVIPIFYEVDPSHIRKQEGTYGDAFLKHQERFTPEIMQKWKDALTESAGLKGWDSRFTRPEAKLLDEVVERVMKKLSSTVPLNSDGNKGLIGMEERCEEVEKLLSIGSPKVRIIGLWGMGGIGKTTLANVVYSRIVSHFDSCCILQNVREKAEKHNGLEKLRKKLFAKLIREKKVDLETPYLLYNVERRLKDRKVLIVLDDVSTSEQLQHLVRDGNLFGSGSRILLTTRNQEVLRTIELAEGIERCPYEVEKLTYKEALDLFNLTAFSKRMPPTSDFAKLSEKVVYYAGGNPLVIKVLGRSHLCTLCSPSNKNWERKLKRYKESPPDEIQNVLRVSYEGLEKDEKSVFLDIACFFTGMRRDFVENILDTGIGILIDKCLVSIGSYGNELKMHDLVQQMGWAIVCEESEKHGERSRLWKAEDIVHVLLNNEGSEKIQGILLNLSTIDEEMCLEPTTFKKTYNLRLLKVYDSSYVEKCKVHLQDIQYLPRSLIYLEWHGYPLNSLPQVGFLRWDLRVLDLSYSNITEIPANIKELSRLKRLLMKDCKKLQSVPELPFGLQDLDASGCASLEVVSNSKQALTQEFWDYVCPKNFFKYIEQSLFCGCLRLDGKQCHDIFIEFQLRVLRNATQFISKEFRDFPISIGACFPGDEIPKWFEYQSEGSCINVKLSPQRHNSSFLGFVLCVVGSTYFDTKCLHLICEMNRGENHKFIWGFDDCSTDDVYFPTTSNSSNVFMWYKCQDYGKCLDEEQASFGFSFQEWGKSDGVRSSTKCRVMKCGVHMLCCKDLEEFRKLNFININKHLLEQSDADEPPSKRIKFDGPSTSEKDF